VLRGLGHGFRDQLRVPIDLASCIVRPRPEEAASTDVALIVVAWLGVRTSRAKAHGEQGLGDPSPLLKQLVYVPGAARVNLGVLGRPPDGPAV
jgi:hypothetical protein